MPYYRDMQIIRTHVYERKLRKLLTESEAVEAENEIALDPKKWPVIVGTEGIRKARAARQSKGKSGGVRILYYYWLIEDEIYLLDIYAKSEQENISAKDKKILRSIIKELRGG
jgi:hypothetical protein